MTGRVSASGSSRWSRSVARPMTSVTNHAPNSAKASGSRAEAERQQPEGDGPDDGRDRRPPVHAAAGRVLLVVLRPAGREAVRGQPEGQPGPGEQPGQRLHGW